MASAAEQLAANMSFSSFAKAKELQQRILFTIGILIVYRLVHSFRFRGSTSSSIAWSSNRIPRAF